MKVLKNKGFTLAEMLIVMAVVVILAAAAAPAIGSQAESAKESNDLNALSQGYIEAYTQAVLEYNSTGKVSSDGYTVAVPITQVTPGWNGTYTVGGQALGDTFKPVKPSSGNTVDMVYSFTGDATASTAVAFAYTGVAVKT